MSLKSNFIQLILLGFFILLGTSCKTNNEQANKQNLSEATGFKVNQLDKQIWSIFQDQNDKYWFGSRDNGVYVYDGKQIIQFLEADGLIDNSIRGIQGDQEGNVYIETPKGVSKYDGKKFTSLHPSSSPDNQWQLSNNDLWFNCNGNPNEVFRYDGESLIELSLPRMDLKKAFGEETFGVGFQDMNNSPYSVYGIDKDRAGNVWFGTVSAGAFRYDGNSFLWIGEKELSTLPDGRVPGVRSILEDKDGYFWVSNFISKYYIPDSKTSNQYKKIEGINTDTDVLEDVLPYFNSGITDHQGNLWMSTYNDGLFKYDGKELQHFTISDEGTDALLIGIHEDKDHVLWLGSDNLGVFMFNGDKFEKFNP